MKRYLLFFFFLISFAIAYFFGLKDILSFTWLAREQAALQQFIAHSFWFSLAIYIVFYTLIVALSFPGALILTLAGGLLFGGFVATPAIVFAGTCGATIVFLVARYTQTDISKLGAAATQLKNGFAKNSFYYLLFLRLTPLFPFWLVNIAPALLGVNLRTFILTTFLGIAPGTAIFAFLGAGLKGVVSTNFDPSSLISREILLALAALGLLSLLPLFFKGKSNAL